ncbi:MULTISPECIES: hypothetical protein [Eubacteriales]|uniref:hypothetical protein n=1 Tax=Eubacteriales TaxID=186802 RepID=UPI002A843074|nr:hypothetical protein [Dysosmobacter sp.]MCI7660316.1 hypothetical protein [Flintibacter sp.]MDY4180741.1 hypothetical protein [Pseudoflavonifractor sp.]MDY5511114.1 hypothetical protein [Dysosmobacter sp.]
MRESEIGSGLLEIYRFLPPPLLEGFDPETAGLDEFLDCLAQARLIQEMETDIVARAIAKAFGE